VAGQGKVFLRGVAQTAGFSFVGLDAASSLGPRQSLTLYAPGPWSSFENSQAIGHSVMAYNEH